MSRAKKYSKYRSGNVFRIPLPFNLGFAYGRLLKFLDVPDGLLLMVYDLVEDEKVEIEVLKKRELLFGPQVMAGLPKTSAKDSIKYIGNFRFDSDHIAPDFKDNHNMLDYEKPNNDQRWFPIVNFERKDYCDYKKVMHLEGPAFNSIEDIKIRIVMEKCKINKTPYTKYFDVTKDIYRNIYYSTINTPIYSEIPKNLRGVAIGYENSYRRRKLG